MLRGPDGRIREVAVPPGADPTRVAAAGDLAVAPTPEGALTVFNLRTDIERGQVSLGRFDPNTITGLAISPEGDVAATVPVGDGDDVLLWAPAGATRVRELARGHEYSRVAVGGGRVAFVAADGLREGVRAFVIDPRPRRIVFRGPPAFDVSSLSFDGRNIAFALPGCLVAGPAVSRRTIPPGPCSRTDVAVDTARLREDAVSVRVACINAPRPPLPRRGPGDDARGTIGRAARRPRATWKRACAGDPPEPSRPRRPRAAHGPRRGT